MLSHDIEAIEKAVEQGARFRFKWTIILILGIFLISSIEWALLFGTLIHQMEPPNAVIAIPTDTPDPGIGL